MPEDDEAGGPPWEVIGQTIWDFLRKTRSGRILAFGIVDLVGLGWLIGELDTLVKFRPSSSALKPTRQWTRLLVSTSGF